MKLDLSLDPLVDRQINHYYRPDLYWLGWTASGLLYDTVYRRTIEGLENIPPAGTGLIFAANHRSNADPTMVGSSIPFPVFFFAKQELFDVPLVGWWCRRVNSLPVRRQAQDVSAIRKALDVVRSHRAILVFPEGGRRLDPARQFVAKAGVGMIACMARVPVVPVGVIGTDRFTRLAKVTVRFGAPLYPPADAKKEDYQSFSNLIMERIKELCHAQ